MYWTRHAPGGEPERKAARTASAQLCSLIASALGVIAFAQPIAFGADPVRTPVESQQAPAPSQNSDSGGKAPPVFEVTSVKENTSGSRQSNFVTTPGRVAATNVNLYQLISVAYNGAPMPMGTL